MCPPIVARQHCHGNEYTQTTTEELTITGILDFVHRPEFYKLENNVLETGSVSVLS
jgi:hypothetical protein